MKTHRISAEGATLEAREHGPRDAPHVVLVHGYPDDQTLWDDVLPHLDGFHVVTYDVRGAGLSTAPRQRRAYRIDRLVDDLVAVTDALVPAGEPFHLVAHDWGSIALWAAVDASAHDPRLARLASYTSMSGPSMDHVGELLRSRRAPRLLKQALHSWYVWAFQVPLLPELFFRHGPVDAALGGVNNNATHNEWSPHLRRDAHHGVRLYRANILQRLLRPRRHGADLPILLVIALQDRFVTPVLLDGMEACYPRLRRVELATTHWVPRERPEEVAALVREHVLGTISAPVSS